MTVGAVTSVNSYDNDAYQYQFFGSVISSERLEYLMHKYGVIQTGDEYYDLRRLYEAMSAYYTQYGTFDVDQASNQPSQQAAWAPLMAQVGLAATGNKDDDYHLFMLTIEYLGHDATEDEKVWLAGLVYQSQAAFAAPEPQQNSVEASAIDLTAIINRAYVMG